MKHSLSNRHDEIVLLVRDGWKPTEIADKLRINRQVLSSYLFKQGIDPITRHWDWVMENKGKMTIAAMARELGVGCFVLKKKLEGKKTNPTKDTPRGKINLALHSNWS